MLVKLKRARTHVEDRHLALCLATSAGLLNAMALSAFGLFPSHMTGNASQLSSDLNSMDSGHCLLFLSLLSAFVIGAVAARITIIMGIRNGLRTIFSCILVTEGVALILTSCYETLFYSPDNNNEVVMLLAFLMGVHNSTSTQLSNGRVRSTHITGTLTDAGIAIGSVVAALLRNDPSKNVIALRQQLNTHIITILSFLCGGILGLFFFRLFGFTSLSGPGIMLIVAAVSSIAYTVYKVKSRLHCSSYQTIK